MRLKNTEVLIMSAERGWLEEGGDGFKQSSLLSQEPHRKNLERIKVTTHCSTMMWDEGDQGKDDISKMSRHLLGHFPGHCPTSDWFCVLAGQGCSWRHCKVFETNSRKTINCERSTQGQEGEEKGKQALHTTRVLAIFSMALSERTVVNMFYRYLGVLPPPSDW